MHISKVMELSTSSAAWGDVAKWLLGFAAIEDLVPEPKKLSAPFGIVASRRPLSAAPHRPATSQDRQGTTQ